MLLSFCAKKVTKEGAFTGGVAILPPSSPLQTLVQAKNNVLSLTLLKSTNKCQPSRVAGEWDHSEGVCESNYV